MSPSSTVHGGQYETKYGTLEILSHAAFVTDESWRDMPEPAHVKFELLLGLVFIELLYNPIYAHILQHTFWVLLPPNSAELSAKPTSSS